MTEDLKTAFAVLERRGETAGGEAIVARAFADNARPAPAPARRPPRWLAVAAIAATAAVITGVLYVRSEAGHLRRVDVTAALGEGSASYGPMNVLIVGTDGARADLIMIARLDPGGRRAAIVSIPRDLWVSDDRLSNTFVSGPGALIAAVRARLGIGIDHFVQVDFGGFRDLVSIVGGVTVPFGAPTRDRVSGLDVPAGCARLDGDQTLTLVRSRHLETLEDGRWRTDPTGDLGRIQREQYVVRQLVAAVGGIGVGNPLTANRLVNAFVDHAVVDTELSTATLLRLARDFHALTPDAITMLTLPTTPVSVGGAAALEVDESTAAPVLAALSDGGGASPASSSAPSPNCQ